MSNNKTKWTWLNDEENLEENINNYISENGLEGMSRGQIVKVDPTFYNALYNHGFIDYLPEIKDVLKSPNIDNYSREVLLNLIDKINKKLDNFEEEE